MPESKPAYALLSRGLSAAILASLLAGCMSVSPMAVMRMASFNPLEVDPEHIQVAAVVPDQISIRDGDVILILSHEADHPDGVVDERFELARAPIERPNEVRIGAGEEAHALRFAQNDTNRFRQAQERIRSYRQSGGTGGSGMLLARLEGGCLKEPLPSGALPVSIYMRTNSSGSYFPLIVRADLRRERVIDVISFPGCSAQE